MRRLPPVAGELIDRARTLTFTFEGQRVTAYAGDTITSALMASGARVLGRSFKYHRPRGVLSAANHDANAIVQVRRAGRSVPNVRADVVAVEDGWQVTAVNTRGGLARDRLRVLNRLAPFLPVGFYYKAFHSKRLFPRWERMFRALTGLGEVDLAAPRVLTPKRYDFCDVLVVGAGPSGLSAALAAAERGAAVLLVDENPAPGGSGIYSRGEQDDSATATLALIADAQRQRRIRLLPGTYAAGYYADHWVSVVAAECLVKVRARSVVIAQGACEQPAVFRGNDLPGVMLASAAQRLIYRYAVAPARRVAVLTANAEGYAAAQDALRHGIEVAAVLDLRPEPGSTSQRLKDALTRRGIPVEFNVRPRAALAAGRTGLAALDYESGAGGATRRLDIDGLWMSVGFAPANALLLQAGGQVRYEKAVEQFVPDALPAGVYACGKVNGHYAFADRVADGRAAGARAAERLGLGAGPAAGSPARGGDPPSHPFPVFQHPKGKEFVDFDEDLQLRDLANACQEGFDGSELMKRYSTLGMGPSQGKHSNMNGLRVLAKLRGEGIEALRPTTARPMFHPVPLSHLAGRGFTPERRTPLDGEHAARGAVWMPAGNWRRPEYYAVEGKTRAAAIADEVRAVRSGVGIIDVGTLGKVEVHGPRAAEFLERVYAGRFANLKLGMTRYGLMLDEAGIVIDDGVIGRLGPETFYFTTTTGNSATLFREFGRLATMWGLPVGLVNLTGHYAAVNVAGPASRRVLGELTGLALGPEAFPYLGLREAEVAGVACRILRVGFVGELGYEIHMPAEYAQHVWRALLAAGASRGIRPFGVEAQRMLRLEKGHIIIGQDTDGVTNALEIGMPWAIRMDKPFFIGQRSLRILQAQSRPQTLVGFTLPPDLPNRPKECHLVLDGSRIAGRITSVGVSPTLGRTIGLALVEPRLAASGTLRIRVDGGALLSATIEAPPFYDASGARQEPGEVE
jgi:sarcosine oxidase subunit alpha